MLAELQWRLLWGIKLTKSGIQHVERHLVGLLCSCDSNQTLIAVVLRLVDFDHATTKLPDLVDLRSALANDSTDHVVWNEDLLRKRLTWHSLDRV